jgi:hypothetical protein
MERLVAGRDNGIVARSLWPDGSGPDFDYGKADDGKAKPAQPGRACVCVLALAEQSDPGARRPLPYGRGVGVRVRAGSAPLCRGWFRHPSRPQPVRKDGRPSERRPAIYAVTTDGTPALLAVDYGHYSVKIFAVRTILAPVIDAELARARKKLTPHQGLVELSPLAPGRDRTERGRAVRDASAVLPPWHPHPSPRQPHSPGDAGGRGARSACRRESTSRQR